MVTCKLFHSGIICITNLMPVMSYFLRIVVKQLSKAYVEICVVVLINEGVIIIYLYLEV